MILIQKNTTNRISLTLNERSSIYATGGTPYYLFEFTNSQSNQTTYFNPQFISATTRANVFDISESDTENLTGGTVSLKTGYYEYRIFEQTDKYNLSLSATTGQCIEFGKVLVRLIPTTNITYTAGTISSNIIYYNE